MKYPIKDIITIFDNPEVVGDTSVELSAIAALDKATPSDLSFLGNKKYAYLVPETKAGAILLPRDYSGKLPENSVIIRVDNPSVELAKIGTMVEKFLWPKINPQIHSTAIIDPKAKIGENVFIGPNVIVCEGAEIASGTVILGNNYIGRFVKIGQDAYLMPNSVVMDYCELGNRARLQPGAVIGSDGYGYEFVNGEHVKVPQIGKVVICDDVEIGANTCIDRARFDKTIVGKGTKVDNLVQIAHNVEIGQGALLVSQVGISGSTKIGNYAILGGQVGVAGHLKIGDGVMIGGQSGVNGNIEKPADYPANKPYVLRGSPARPYMKAQRLEAYLDRLDTLFERVKRLEEKHSE